MSTRPAYYAIGAAVVAFFAASVVVGIVIGPISGGESGEQLGGVLITLACTAVGGMCGWRQATKDEQHEQRRF